MRRAISQLARTLLALVDGDVRVRDLLRSSRSLTSIRMVQGLRAWCGEVFTLLDVGANVGQFALASARIFPQAEILSFEPVPRAAATLRANTKQENRIRVFQCALGRETRIMSFRESAYSPVSSALPISRANKERNYDAQLLEFIEVQVRRLDDSVGDLFLRPPVLLKLDVQGFELEVLEGAGALLPDAVDYIVVECAFVELYDGQPTFEEVHFFLRQRGYRLVAPVSMQWGRGDRVIEADFLFHRAQPS